MTWLMSFLQTACRTDRALASRSATLALVFGMIAFGAAIFYAVLLNDVEPVQSDSEGYMEFSVERTVGYPAFLAMFRIAGFGLPTVTIVQLVLFCAATWMLALETAAITRSALAASFVL